MVARNHTLVTEFIILGFPSLKTLHPLPFLLLLIMYLLTVLGNIVIITVVWIEARLHTPMYFYIGNFSFLEIWYTTVIVPKMLQNILTGNNIISFFGCIFQLFFFFFLSSTECFLLVAMAYDRYLAICNPLRYSTLMNPRVCVLLVLIAWMGGFLSTFIPILLLSQLPFCGPNVINHFFCDAPPLLKLSCADTYLNDLLDFVCASAIIVTSFTLILISYIYIIITISKIPSVQGKKRAFSTCASHLIVVVIYYGTVTFMYVRPKVSFSFDLNKVVAVFYTVFTPILNPVIYCLRNKEVKKSLSQVLSAKTVCIQ
ncbi:olfactory receptor 6N1-like [Rhinatrema bivittatum]|uniref:olfactory receptor 6N1-like n=1 Tax=Rhinatrema bivittatum TaxID=194408 RepID=UPI00112C59F5|nr:olfactory receptor 6N1-like [Rhinatrema bivittatum]